MMKKCNSTDMEDIIHFVKTTENINYKNAWETVNLQTIITSIETKLTLIWEQIREKEMLSYQQQQLLEHIDIIKCI